MSKKCLSLVMAIIMMFAMVVPMTVHAETMTQREAADFFLHWLGYTDEEIQRGGGVDESAISIDLVQDYIPEYPCSGDQFETFRQRALKIANMDPMPEIPAKFLVTYSAGKNGTVAAKEYHRDYFLSGEEITLIATPEKGFALRHWVVNGQIVKGSETQTFVITEKTDIQAQFKLKWVPDWMYDLGLFG